MGVPNPLGFWFLVGILVMVGVGVEFFLPSVPLLKPLVPLPINERH